MTGNKAEFRAAVKERLKALGETEREALSVSACAYICGMEEFIRAGTVLSYKPIKNECSPEPLNEYALSLGKRVAYPLCLPENRLELYLASSAEDFRAGSYGILEPDPGRCERIGPDGVDFAVIPGLAFDEGCMRLGRGAGYYDRLLCSFEGVKAGLAYFFQVFPSLPAEKTDVPMDFVVTNNGIIVKNQQLCL